MRCVMGTLWVTALLLAAHPAQAGTLDACKNVLLGPNVSCVVEPPGVTCEGKCEPVRMEVSCASQLFTECKPQCTATVVETEVQVCSNNCVTECNLNPGSFSCSGSCGTKCTADCSAKCTGSTNASQCNATCKASCTGYCDAECSVVLPSATCQQKCTPSCKGVMVAKVNMDCQVKCQTVERYTSCETKLVGGCKAKCTGTEGAIFCDGQFVDYLASIDDCINALKALKFSVEWSVKVDLSGCAVGGGGASWAILLAFIPIFFRRRRG